MIKNVVASGCSFTEGISWTVPVANHFQAQLYNLGHSGAGNRYIANSVIDCLQYKDLNPESTLVIVMWSGPGRKDALVSGEYWYLLSDYPGKAKFHDYEDCYWIFSGGRSNAWCDHIETRKIFEQDYLVSDPVTICKETLDNVIKLQIYLKYHGFKYFFMSYVNYWKADIESTVNGDFNIKYFAGHIPAFQKIDWSPWIFSSNTQDGIYEFSRDQNILHTDEFHPSLIAHNRFASEVIIPRLVKENL
jgi:hypothetical protein